MNKTHNMSHTRLTLPIAVEHLGFQGKLKIAPGQKPPADPADLRFRFDYDYSAAMGSLDPWKLRAEFLSWPRDLWDGFIAMAGAFGSFRISERDFVEWQGLLREALIRPPREWAKLKSGFNPAKVERLFQPLPIRFDWGPESPIAIVRTRTVLNALIATVQVDALRGMQFRVCARVDCTNAPFAVAARQKIYCSSDCAHLVAVRESRRRAAEGKEPAKRFARRKGPQS